jgi:hypothetical protein
MHLLKKFVKLRFYVDNAVLLADRFQFILIFLCNKKSLKLNWLVFQVFGLVKDPASDNNWKIKHTEARLVAKVRNC